MKEKKKKKIISEQKQLNELKNKYQTNSTTNKKDREEIEILKNQFNKLQEDSRKKELNNKALIDKYKNQIEIANNKIIELNGILNKLKPNKPEYNNDKNNKNRNKTKNNNNNKNNKDKNKKKKKENIPNKNDINTNQKLLLEKIKDEHVIGFKNNVPANSNKLNNEIKKTNFSF